MDRLWAPWRMAYVGSHRDADTGCFLCRASDRTAAGLVVESTNTTFTVLNRYPYGSGHLMVVPHRHVPDISTLNTDESMDMMSGAQRAVAALQLALNPPGFNLGINQGHCAGGSVSEHLHLHVVPRWPGDTNFMPVLADVKVLPEHLESTAAKLRSAYGSLGEG